MGLNLSDILIVILIPSSIVRLLVLVAIYRKFSLIFGGRKNIVQGSKLFGELENISASEKKDWPGLPFPPQLKSYYEDKNGKKKPCLTFTINF